MAKKVDFAKAKAAKQKKIAIGLGVLFVGVLAFQGPKTLKMLKGPSTPAAVAAPAPTPAAATPTPTPTPGVATPVAAPSAGQPAVLASSDQPVVAGEGQLLSFELFASKDPFTQQVDPDRATAEPTPPAAAGAGAGSEPKPEPKPEPDPEPAIGITPPTTTAPTPPAPTETPALPAKETMISVNDVLGAAVVGQGFPAEDPIFVLVSTAPDGTSVEIGIAGGTYADGEDTITLKLGKALTLQNTTDGSRYELLLETVAGFVPPDSK